MRGLDRKVSLNRGRIEVSGKAREQTSTFADYNARNLSILSKVSSLSLFEIIPAGPIALLCTLFRQEATDGLPCYSQSKVYSIVGYIGSTGQYGHSKLRLSLVQTVKSEQLTQQDMYYSISL
ncbi:hypothetical protein ABZX51_001916 [Aspergillus tubingensis]